MIFLFNFVSKRDLQIILVFAGLNARSGSGAAQAELAAKAVKVEVFGGDAIVTPDGKIYIIDINSWPSFARVRADEYQ